MNKTVIYDDQKGQFGLTEGGGGSNIPIGTDRQVLGYEGGVPTPVTLGWMEFSDLETPPTFNTGVVTGTTFNPDGSAMFYFHEINDGIGASAKASTIPVYGTNGVLKVATAVATNDAVTKAQLDAKPNIGTTSTTAKVGNYTPTATEIVTAINAMTPEQVTTVQTKLGITP